MRLVQGFVCAVAVALVVPAMHAFQMDPDRVVPGGGIFVKGWQGQIDSQSTAQGRTINDSKVSQEGPAMVFALGPAAVYWNPANTASGNYTVSATFREPKVKSASSHEHPYGIFIAGNKMGTDKMNLVYCTAYGSGRVIVRGFSPDAPKGVFQLLTGPATTNPAVHKTEADGSVSQDLAFSVKDGRAECSVNGTVVAGYDKAQLVAPGKLESTDGTYGIRASHNLDFTVTNFKVTKG